ncbi:MAG: DnaJ domain-containing protein [Polyangiaceae bacterium]
MSDVHHKPTATAKGTLQKSPVPNLFVYVAERKLSGSLTLTHPAGPTVVLTFRQGMLQRLRTSEPVAHLGTILFDLGFIPKDVLEETQKTKIDDGGLHGRILLEANAITEEQLTIGLDRQIVAKLDYVFTLPKATEYAFYDGADMLAGFGGDVPPRAFDPFTVLWRGLCLNPPWPQVDAAFEKIRGSRLRLRPGADVDALGLNPDVHAFVVTALAEPKTLEDVANAGVLQPHTAKLALYCLLVTKRIETVAVARPPFEAPSSTMMKVVPPGSANVPVAAPIERTLSPELAARRDAIRETGAAIDKMNYFEMLGLAEDATKEAVDDAYRELAKKWHPDRLPPDLAEVKDIASRVFGLYAEAHKTLTDEGDRKKYMKLVREGGATPEAQAYIARVIDAATTFQKAEISFRRGDMAMAADFCKQAFEGDPTQSDYVALLAWIESMDPKNQGDAATRERIAMLDRALSINARSDRAHYYRGMLYKKLGENKLALVDMKKAIELNPRNLEAPREIRLLESRQNPGGPAAKPATDKGATPGEGVPSSKMSGLFSKLLKK